MEKRKNKDNKDIAEIDVRTLTSGIFKDSLDKLKRCQKVTVGNRLKVYENLDEIARIKSLVSHNYNALVQKYGKHSIFGKIKTRTVKGQGKAVVLKDPKKFKEEYEKMMKYRIKLNKIFVKDFESLDFTEEEKAAIILLMEKRVYEKQKNVDNISPDLDNSEFCNRLQDVSRKDRGEDKDKVCSKEEREKEESNCNCKES